MGASFFMVFNEGIGVLLFVYFVTVKQRPSYGFDMYFDNKNNEFDHININKYWFIYFLSVFFLFALLFQSPAYGDDEKTPIRFAGTYVPVLLDDTHKDGLYLQLFERIKAKAEQEITLSIMPIRRAQSNFYKGLYDCVFVGTQDKQPYLEAGMPEGSFIASDHINKLKIKAYTPDTLPVVQNIEQMQGRIITGEVGAVQAFIREYPAISGSSSILQVETLQNAINLVESKRADVIVSFDLDMHIFIKANQNLKVRYRSSTFNLLANNESVVCRNSEVGQKVITIVNDILASEPVIEGFTR